MYVRHSPPLRHILSLFLLESRKEPFGFPMPFH
jgi:hypothetical protein